MCGICGIASSKALNLDDLLMRATHINNRGHEATGIATGNPMLRFVAPGLVRDIDHHPCFPKFRAAFLEAGPQAAIAHTRYSTVGPSDEAHGQPISMKHLPSGLFDLVHNGQIPNHDEIRHRLESNGHRFSTQSDSEVLAAVIAHSTAESLPEAVADMMQQVPGAYSILVLNKDHLIAARDEHGVWPLWYVRLPDGTHLFSSEAGPLDETSHAQEIAPGAMAIVTLNGHASTEPRYVVIRSPRSRRCFMDTVYLSRPDQREGTSPASTIRRALGQQLARACPVVADLVIGVPDSGLYAAQGFAEASGIPYEWGFTRNRFAPGSRSFILPEEDKRSAAIDAKQSISRVLVSGQRVVVVDDSLVRSRTATILTTKLQEAGAAEIHWRIAAPPISHPCFYGIDTPDQTKLVGHWMSEEEIARVVGATSLKYLPAESMWKVLSLFHTGWCKACVTGEYPIPLAAPSVVS